MTTVKEIIEGFESEVLKVTTVLESEIKRLEVEGTHQDDIFYLEHLLAKIKEK